MLSQIGISSKNILVHNGRRATLSESCLFDNLIHDSRCMLVNFSCSLRMPFSIQIRFFRLNWVNLTAGVASCQVLGILHQNAHGCVSRLRFLNALPGIVGYIFSPLKHPYTHADCHHKNVAEQHLTGMYVVVSSRTLSGPIRSLYTLERSSTLACRIAPMRRPVSARWWTSSGWRGRDRTFCSR